MKINKKASSFILTMSMISGFLTVPSNVLAETTANTFPEIISFENGEVEDGLNYKFQKDNVTTKVVNGALNVEYAKSDWPGLKMLPKNSDSWNLGEDGAVSFKLYNPEESARTFYVKLYEGLLDGTEDEKSIVYKASIGAGETQTFNVALGEEMPSLGMHAIPPNDSGTLMSYGWGKQDINLSHVTQITFWQMYNTEVNTLIFDDIKIIENPTKDLSYMDGIVDEYGQYTKDEWINKITSDEDMIEDIETENQWLDKEIEKRDNSGNYTKYGGYKNDEYRQEKTGRFYTTKIDGKWTLIDPEGYPFIATGLDIIRTTDALTWISGRERMFETVPDKNGEYGDHYTPVTGIKPPEGYEGKTGDGYNFYTANLEKKYGEDYIEDWTQTSLKRFKAWGFTSLGCWAEPEIYFGQGSKNQMAYIANGWINEGKGTENIFANVKNLSRGGLIADPFDPKFRGATETMAQKLKDQGVNDDEWCYGIYIDNEIDWGNGNVEEQHYSVIDGAFSVDAKDSPAKTEFIRMLKEKYSNIQQLNSAWGTNLQSFDELNAPYNDYAKIAKEDKSEMLSAIANQYYKTVDEVLNEYLPNVLYMGSRIAEWGTSKEVTKACANYVDVISFNCYKDDVNQSWMDFEQYDKPVIIGEFHFNAMDTGFFAPGLKLVNSQEERGESYVNYMESVFESSQFVGAQWFQYYDQPVLGRAWDGENNNIGFVDVADQPYEPLVNAAKQINEKGYELRFNFITAEKVNIEEDSVVLTKEEPTIKLEASVYPENSTNKNVTWKSSDNNVVTVDENGVITAIGDGSATITAVSKSNQYALDTCGVTVEGFSQEATPILFDKIDFENGDEEVSYNMMIAGVNAANATTEIKDIDGDNKLNLVVNKVTGVDGESATIDFSPKKDVWSFGDNNPLKIDLTNPNNHALQARVNVADATGALRTYYFKMAANESKTVSISEYGAVPANWGALEGFYGAVDTGIDTKNIKLVSIMMWEGDAELPKDTPVSLIIDNIRVELDEEEVKPDKEVLATTVVLDKEEVELLVDETEKLTATINPVDATDKTVNWTTSNSNIATVDEEGNIKAISVGTAYIGVVSNANKDAIDYCKVIVTEVDVPETPEPEKPKPEEPDTEKPKPENPDTEKPGTEEPDGSNGNDDKNPVEPEVDSENDKDDLPQTGGMNNLYILLAGLGVSVTGGTILYKNKKKK